MKKIVNILVMIIAAVAIVIVALFGISSGTSENIHITSLTVLNTDGSELAPTQKLNEEWPDKRINIEFDKQGEDIDTGYPVMAYLFNIAILPEKAKGNAVSWSVAGEESIFSVPQSNVGQVIITKTPGLSSYKACRLYCTAADGSKGTDASIWDGVYIRVHFGESGEGGSSTASS